MTWNEKDLIWCPAIGLEGQILRISDDRAQVWWEDDDVSWEHISELRPLSDRDTSLWPF